jgi:hypothetical protein
MLMKSNTLCTSIFLEIQDYEKGSFYICVNTVNALLPDVDTLQTLVATQSIDHVVQVRPKL